MMDLTICPGLEHIVEKSPPLLKQAPMSHSTAVTAANSTAVQFSLDVSSLSLRLSQ